MWCFAHPPQQAGRAQGDAPAWCRVPTVSTSTDRRSHHRRTRRGSAESVRRAATSVNEHRDAAGFPGRGCAFRQHPAVAGSGRHASARAWLSWSAPLRICGTALYVAAPRCASVAIPRVSGRGRRPERTGLRCRCGMADGSLRPRSAGATLTPGPVGTGLMDQRATQDRRARRAWRGPGAGLAPAG